MSAGAPRMCTGSSARVRGVSFRTTSSGSSVSDSSTSASTGMAPVAMTALAVAFHVYAGMITSSPGPTPAPIRPQISADEPALTHERVPRAEVRCELALEVRHLVRPVADAVVAEDVLAADDARDAPRAPPRRSPCRRGTSAARAGCGRAGRRRGRGAGRGVSRSCGPFWTQVQQRRNRRSPADSLPALALDADARVRLRPRAALGALGNADFPERAALGPGVRRGADRDHGGAVGRPRAPEGSLELGDRSSTSSARQPSDRACATQSTSTCFGPMSSNMLLNGGSPGRPAVAGSPHSRRCRRARDQLAAREHDAEQVGVQHQVGAVAEEQKTSPLRRAIRAPQAPAIS